MEKIAPRILRNRDMIQSYLITSAKYDFTADEKRILYVIVSLMQSDLEDKELKGKIEVNPSLFGDLTVKIPISAVSESTNYERIYKAFKSLSNKKFEYEDDKVWAYISIIANPRHEKREGLVEFVLAREVYQALLNFKKGYQVYEIEKAIRFKKVSSMRLYELVSEKTKPITYSIQKLKEMFCVANRYANNSDFIKYMIQPAQEELKLKSPWGFEYEVHKSGVKITSITISPRYHPENRDPELERIQLQKVVNLSWDMPLKTRDYLVQNFGFTIDEIKHNIELFKMAITAYDLELELSQIKRKAMEAKNPKGYVINFLKRKMKIPLNVRIPSPNSRA